jgi:hypothetical protein
MPIKGVECELIWEGPSYKPMSLCMGLLSIHSRNAPFPSEVGLMKFIGGLGFRAHKSHNSLD